MKEAQLDRLVNPLREMLTQWDLVIDDFKKAHGRKVAAYSCDVFPVEVLESFGVLPLRRPPSSCAPEAAKRSVLLRDDESPPWDFHISPRCCGCGSPISGNKSGVFFSFDAPAGYGEEAAERLHGSLDSLLREMDLGGIEELRIPALQTAADEYDRLRRLVRGICSVRNEKPAALSHSALFIVFAAAVSLPTQLVIGHLEEILVALNSAPGEPSVGELLKGMACGGILGDGGILDSIERAGCLITEDDFCNGRRQFDISLNVSSNYLYYEMLDAASYRPLCPSARGAGERFELLYKMLGSHGIEFVVFVEDTMCVPAQEALEYLRIRLMRSGVDPLRLRSEGAQEQMKEYLASIR